MRAFLPLFRIAWPNGIPCPTSPRGKSPSAARFDMIPKLESGVVNPLAVARILAFGFNEAAKPFLWVVRANLAQTTL